MSADSGVFEVDSSLLDSLQKTLGKALHLAVERTSERTNVISSQVRRLALTKFVKLCEHLNIDCTNRAAFAVCLLVMSKTAQPLAAARSFLAGYPECGLQVVGPHALPPGDADADTNTDAEHDARVLACCEHAFDAMSEWLTLLDYVDTASLAPTEHDLEHRLFKHLAAAAAETQFSVPSVPPDVLPCLVLLYRAPRSTQVNLMLQRMAQRRAGGEASSSEISCLRFAGAVSDHAISDAEQHELFASVLRRLRMLPDFASDLADTLAHIATDITHMDAHAAAQHARPRLSDLVQRVRSQQACATQVYTQTIVNWANHVRFPVATSLHLQRILYFVTVQRVPVSPEVFADKYPRDVTDRALGTKPQVIDRDAVIAIIRSLRVYHNDIENLIDFHGSCLQGLPTRKRKELSIVAVLQLYTAANQHDTIWKQCWTAVVPIMNHTIESCRNAFVAKHRFEVDRVVSCAIDCHVGGNV